MKFVRLPLAILLIAITSLSGCYFPPEFPLQPVISDARVVLLDVEDPSARDTLALTFHFTDGDGDLGLRADETMEPYNLRDYPISDVTNDTVEFGDPSVEDIPYAFPYTCLNWDLKLLGFENRNGTQVPIYDTLYYEINEDHYNITIDWFTKPDGSDEWVPFDWRLFRAPSCGETFDGRFPPLFDTEDMVEGNPPAFPMEGDLRYSMTSSGFLLLFGADSMRLDIQIKDRALNVSNTLSTPAFTMPSIRQVVQ